MARSNTTGALSWLAALLALLAILALSGCSTTVGGRTLFFRVAREVPPMVQEESDGRLVELPGVEPRGEAILFFVRGRL